MKRKIFLSFLLTFSAVSLLFFFSYQIKTNSAPKSSEKGSPIKNISEKGEENPNKEEIFTQIDKWISFDKLAPIEDNKQFLEKNQIAGKVVETVRKEAITPEQKVLAASFEQNLTFDLGGVCAGTTKNALKPQVKGISAESGNSSSSGSCDNADPSQCSGAGNNTDKNLTEEGGWGSSTGGQDTTTCCAKSKDADVCGEGTAKPTGQCVYSGEIRKDGPIIKNVQCCSGCCIDCEEDCCDDCECCVASCERKCECRGYKSYIWNSATRECGCGD